MWSRKIIVPLQPMQVLKGDTNGYPETGVELGHPALRVRRRVDRTSRVGLCGRLTTHCKKAVLFFFVLPRTCYKGPEGERGIVLFFL